MHVLKAYQSWTSLDKLLHDNLLNYLANWVILVQEIPPWRVFFPGYNIELTKYL